MTMKNTSYPFRFVQPKEHGNDEKIQVEMDIAEFLRKPCADTETDFIQLYQHSFVEKLFKKFNAICTSSAPAERLFSYAGMKKRYFSNEIHYNI